MSQKIVIKANVKRELQESVPTVSYEWNWRRIVSIAMLVLMTSAAVVYGLTTSASAEQGEHPNEQEQFLSFSSNAQNQTNVEVTDVEPESSINNIPNESAEITQTSIEPLLAAQNEVEQSISNNAPDKVNPVNNDTVLLASNDIVIDQSESINTELNSNLDNDAQEETEEAENIAEYADQSDLLLDQKSDDGALSGTEGFSPTAQVASVALGAQIDTDKISRAVLTRKVSKREPTNVFAADIRLSQFDEGLSFFSEIKNLQGQQVKHVWTFEDETMAEITLNVTSPRYRTYSTKNIMDTQTGHWRVDVVDEQGNLIAQKEFRILAD
ncbi:MULTISPECIES: DUF2914 domain-containing protein [unclassified Pseudoalteromonas]|uniref:DUF2914 domain-containing protein n=1 Tax=unclassified Pseudoalteromonas TaxID=194690 RepID=UPI0013FD2A93|nr:MULTISPECIES: DUF2914 domain-containing protein [unclassified Pseudoalteromonas]MBH0013956.1 DUF2914 domain-containing protein [Pseudoalteromonas sp. NZS100_1]MBH0051540.1 DUF2914 domain-containing protein [Pseudoalteromonas sp. SWYJZ19]MBH0076395.1 DUF2914 domain-containing protein [Pseudoalteromonas sp. SWYJ118]